MSDDQHNRLARRIADAYERAEKTCDPLDFKTFHALNAVAETEIYALKLAAHRIVHGPLGAVADLPHWSQITEPGSAGG